MYDKVEHISMKVLALRWKMLGEEHAVTIRSVSDLEATRQALKAILDRKIGSVSVAGPSL